MTPRAWDVVIIGAGAAGLMCAATAGQRGRRVLLIDHAEHLGERIRISGGGRCNFTNRRVQPENFLSQNPHFVRSALAQYGAQDFITLVERYGIAYHEKTLGQLFCDHSAQAIIDLLHAECALGDVQFCHPCTVTDIARTGAGFTVQTPNERHQTASLVIATGGLAIPKLGASPFGYRIAEQFGLPIVPPQPALVPLAMPPEWLAEYPIAGNSLTITAQGEATAPRFQEQLLFTHRGLSGPAILQASSYWQAQSWHQEKRSPLVINLLPDIADVFAQPVSSKQTLAQRLSEFWPKRLAEAFCATHRWEKPLNQFSHKEKAAINEQLHHWLIQPAGTLGFAKAEVTLGGVDTRALSSKTLAARSVPGLYFIGEVVDVTGWLGGYNFQWAWSSGFVAGSHV
ncbi:NAD(P)/FAD-dependent oxidoreductase [Halothiobacillus sp. DCM-1]|uniref:NAD(P)/FAD-dependent oxidoreductase n=1 Tax=Halothiobacillus sp. DCM-1 TaxID=3112558 RepID=UPI0032465082